MNEGRYTIPTRIYLTQEQRLKLRHLLVEQERELDDLLTELVAMHLEEQNELPLEYATAVGDSTAERLLQRRLELNRLRPRMNDPFNPPAPWLVQLVGELEDEVARLEQIEHSKR